MSDRAEFQLRLYVAGEGPNSIQASVNLRALCERHLADCHQIEIIDVLQEPQRALADGVFLTPMLLKLAPAPLRRIAGTLNDRPLVLAALGLPGKD